LKAGIVLFAHGSRDRAWARPFEQLAATLAKKTHAPVKLAYLELMQPSLEQAIATLVSEGAKTIRVVPVFLGQGGHVKDDLPKLLAAARKRHPGIAFSMDAPIGEQATVIEAIAAAIALSTPRSNSR
jgi:sirohydrochlorin cobaltochelatase